MEETAAEPNVNFLEGDKNSSKSNPHTAHFVVVDEKGLHLRPLGEVVEICGKKEFDSIEVEFFCENSPNAQTADAKSILALMLLAAVRGEQIEVRCRGDEQLCQRVISELSALEFIEANHISNPC